MDIIRTQKRSHRKWIAALLVLIGFLASLFYFLSVSQIGTYTVSRNRLIIAEIKSGDFDVKVSASGKLVNKNPHWITSSVEGVVTKIYAKPGDAVEAGQVLMELSNPALVQAMEELKWDFEASNAAIHAHEVNQKTQLLNSRLDMLKTEMEYEKAKLRFDAYSELKKSKDLTVSQLDFANAKLTARQLEQTLSLEKQRLEQLKLNIKSSYEAKLAELNKLAKQYERAKSQVRELNIVASVSGVLQSMPLEVGQRVTMSTLIAKLVDPKQLLAEFKVPEHNIENVKVGQRALVDTRFDTVAGKVIRIDPSVVEGTILVEVEFVEQLPDGVHSDFSIDGDIYTAQRKNTLFVRRPSYFRENQKMSVYKVSTDNKMASRVKVHFGIASSTDVEILAGLKPQDKIVVSEQSAFEHHEQIAIQ